MNKKTALSVIKLGGSLLESDAQRRQALKTIATCWKKGKNLVLVHGGGQKVDDWLSRLGIPKKTHQGLRITDRETLDVVVSTLAGSVNKALVAELTALGVAACGFSGADAATLAAEFHPDLDGVSLGFVGRVSAVRPGLIYAALERGVLPVLAPIGIASGGTLLNINADQAASALAVALGAGRLLFLTDVEGLLDGNGLVMPKLNYLEARKLLQSDFVHGGMRPKLSSCLEALGGGVPEVIIAGPEKHAKALSKGQGGTLLVAA